MALISGVTTHLLTGLSTDYSSEVHLIPQAVSLHQKSRELVQPVLPQSPREYLILVLILILLHVIGQVARGEGREGGEGSGSRGGRGEGGETDMELLRQLNDA